MSSESSNTITTTSASVAVAVEDQPEYLWARTAPKQGVAPTPRRYAAGGMIHSGHLLVIGGFDARKEPLGDAHVYHVESATWVPFMQRGATTPSARYGAACSIVVASNGESTQVYVFGGAAAKNSALNDLFVLSVDRDGLGGEWTLIDAPNAPSKRYFAAICAVRNKLYFHGGEVNIKRQLNDFFEFDTETRTWREFKLSGTPDKPLPVIRAGHLLFPNSTNSSIVLYGGYTGEGGYDSLFESFRLDLNQIDAGWSPFKIGGQAPMVGRNVSAVRVAQPKPTDGEYLFVFGGFDGAVRQPVSTLHRLTLRADGSIDETLGWQTCKLWLELGDDAASLGKGSKSTFPTPRYGFVWGVDPKTHKAPFFGGSGSTYLNDIQTLDLDDSEPQQ